MNPNSFIYFLVLILILSPVACAREVSLYGLDAKFLPPPTLSVSKEMAISSRYDETDCIEFQITKRKAAAGFLCSSASAEFLADFGISTHAVNAGQSGASQGVLYKLATPMSAYDMEPVLVGAHRLYIADIDCDEANEAIYRATSTCQVAIMPLEEDRFLYSNFVLENHITSTSVATRDDLRALWEGIEGSIRLEN